MKPLPSQAELCTLLDYNPETGVLTWKRRPGSNVWNAKYAGKVAGKRANNGYLMVSVNGKYFLAHRLIWKMVHGVDPGYIDHANGLTTDNRLANLRNASHGDNMRNRRAATSACGLKGVSQSKGYWRAAIKVNRTTEYLGQFRTKEDAARAYDKRAIELHGEFAATNASLGLLT